MADQIKELIEKINQEGVVAGQEKARQIEADAQARAQALLQKTEAQARKLVSDAEEKVKRLETSSQASLKQAGRDLVLTLKKDILALLERLVAQDVSGAMSAETMSGIISGLVKEYCAKDRFEVTVYLNDRDKQKLEGHFLNKLRTELKNGIELKAQDDIRSGFIISFDSGKSHFDFSEAALTQYLANNLKPKVAEIFKDTK